jgi:hypothetical protein
MGRLQAVVVKEGPTCPPSRTADGKLLPFPNVNMLTAPNFQTWSVRIPRTYSFEDIFRVEVWRNVELAHQARASRPVPSDIVRATAENGEYDVFLIVENVIRGSGYELVYSHGRLPEAGTP